MRFCACSPAFRVTHGVAACASSKTARRLKESLADWIVPGSWWCAKITERRRRYSPAAFARPDLYAAGFGCGKHEHHHRRLRRRKAHRPLAPAHHPGTNRRRVGYSDAKFVFAFRAGFIGGERRDYFKRGPRRRSAVDGDDGKIFLAAADVCKPPDRSRNQGVLRQSA